MMNEAIRKRLEDALTSGTLKELCDQMKSEGLSQVAIYDHFASFWRVLGDTKTEADDDALGSSLECIVGFCGPGAGWFDHYLSNEEIYAYQSGLTEKEVQEISALVMNQKLSQLFCGIHREPTGDLTVKTAQVRGGIFSGGTTFTVRKHLTGWEVVSQKPDRPGD